MEQRAREIFKQILAKSYHDGVEGVEFIVLKDVTRWLKKHGGWFGDPYRQATVVARDRGDEDIVTSTDPTGAMAQAKKIMLKLSQAIPPEDPTNIEEAIRWVADVTPKCILLENSVLTGRPVNNQHNRGRLAESFNDPHMTDLMCGFYLEFMKIDSTTPEYDEVDRVIKILEMVGSADLDTLGIPIHWYVADAMRMKFEDPDKFNGLANVWAK